MKIHNHTLPKAIRRHSIRRWLATAITMTAMLTITLTATLATLTGCSADNDPQTATGGDGTSISFGATIDSREAHGNAPASRAITDGSFDDGDQIVVHTDGERKIFVYRTGQGFEHDSSVSIPGISSTSPEWKTGETQKNVLAYGPLRAISSNGNSELIYRCFAAEDQSKDDDYEKSDYVYAAQMLQRSQPALTFRHGMTRIVVRLRSGGSLKDEEVAGATVLLGDKNLLSIADIDPQTGTLTAHAPAGANELPPQTITPHRCADTPTGFVAAYEALLPPQDVSGKQFIRVRLSDGTQLGYVAESGSLLEGGHEYVYNATVEENRVVVTISDSDVPWQDGILTTEIDGKEFRLIRTAEDLARFARDVNGDGTSPSKLTTLNALQTADIDLQDLARSTDPDLQKLAEDWVPIGSRTGSYAPTYEGIYCGNGHTISGLRIKSDHGASKNALFGSINGNALLTGIHLRNVRITGTIGGYIGALAGYAGAGTVTLCSAEGTIETTLPGGGTSIGGLVGAGSGCSINRCRTEVNINVTQQGDGNVHVGGIVGDSREGSTLFACRSEGEVSLTGTGTLPNGRFFCTGGIAGYNGLSHPSIGNKSCIYACMAAGNVSATHTGTDAVDAYAGGLVGYNDDEGNLEFSYARGTATATSSKAKGYAGAIIGGRNGSDIISSCFGTGAGGAGTSGLKAVSNSIVYNEKPGQGEIETVIEANLLSFSISTTLYNTTATPAYGINVIKSEMTFNNVWNPTDPIWPALNMEENGR